jgi:hypothetical protein
MVEAETITMAADMQHLLGLIERLYKSALETVLKQSAADVEYHHKKITSPEAKVCTGNIITNGTSPTNFTTLLGRCETKPRSAF